MQGAEYLKGNKRRSKRKSMKSGTKKRKAKVTLEGHRHMFICLEALAHFMLFIVLNKMSGSE